MTEPTVPRSESRPIRRIVAIGLFAIASVLARPVMVSGQEKSLSEAMGECAEIRPLLERLRCYDQLSRDVATFEAVVRETCGPTGRAPDQGLAASRRQQGVADAVAAIRAGTAQAAGAQEQLTIVRDAKVEGIDLTPNWKVDEVRNAEGVAVEVRLSTQAEKPLVEGGNPPTLNILCRQRKTMLWLETGSAGSGDTTQVGLTFPGEEKPVEIALDNTQNGLAMGLWGGAETVLQPWIGRTKVTAKYLPRDVEQPVEASFDLTGFADAIDVIRLQCGW